MLISQAIQKPPDQSIIDEIPSSSSSTHTSPLSASSSASSSPSLPPSSSLSILSTTPKVRSYDDQKTRVRRRWQLETSHRWRVGQYVKTSRHIGTTVSDPFSTSPIPMEPFLRQLFPILQQSHLFASLRRVATDVPDPILQWLNNVSLNKGTSHGAYLLGHAMARRLLNGPVLSHGQVQGHLGSALSLLRTGLQESTGTQSLAQLNIMLAAFSYFHRNTSELSMHTKASKEIVDSMGGISKVDPILRSTLLISAPIVFGTTLVAPPWHASDFDMLAREDDPMIRGCCDRSLSIWFEHPALESVFKAHTLYQRVLRQYQDEHGFDNGRHPVQFWLDNRFHILNLLSLETYFEVHRLPIDISESQRVDIQINSILVLALSYCHQFIYFHNRTPSGLLEDQVAPPIFTIPFFHLRVHLERLLQFENFDLMKRYEPVLWAAFVLACHERVMASCTTSESTITWGESLFQNIRRRLPEEESGMVGTKHLFERYLYDSSLDVFLESILGMHQIDKKRTSVVR